jgi:hypothetical protein
LEGGGLSVRFHRREDRFAHEVWLVDRGAWVQVLASCEGLPLDDWPASPPLQSLTVERRAGERQLALLVGMAGHSHWSASVELEPAAACLTFDVACRVRDRGPLRSCYRTLLPLTELQDRRATFASGDARAPTLELELCEPIGPARLELAGDLTRIQAMPHSTIVAAQTIRWGYKISLRRAAPTT